MYPVGVPLLYFFTLWTNRNLLNPGRAEATPGPGMSLLEAGEEDAAAAAAAVAAASPFRIARTGYALDENGCYGGSGDGGDGGRLEGGGDDCAPAWGLEATGEEKEEGAVSLEERVRLRAENPELAPSKFLWKDFGD